jgi:hypothetical protein
MAKDKISQYAFTPAANTDIGGINIDEGCAPSGINNAIRTLMTQIRDLQAGVSGDTVPLTAGGTGSGTAASARAALGLAIGTNVLGYVTPGTSGNVLQSDGANWTSVAQGAAVTLDNITGGPLAVAKGGTGATALASGSVLVGNGTSIVSLVAPGTTGNVLTSNGSTWTSAAGGGYAGFSTVLFAASGSWTPPTGITRAVIYCIGGGGGGGTVNGAVGGTGGFGGVYITGLSGAYTITIGTGGAAGAAGTTSSFGSIISSTGGAAGTTVAGANGSSTVSSGTTLKLGSVFNDYNSLGSGKLSQLGGPSLNKETSGSGAMTWSISTVEHPGATGAGSTTAGNRRGGFSGIVFIQY